MKAQSAIISTVLLSGVILAIVTATYVWGQPLVQKTTDKIKIDSIVNDLTTIKNRIEHTQQTGSPSEVTLNIQNANYQISQDENGVIVKTTTLIPVITSYVYIPMDYTELAYETRLTDISTTLTGSTATKPTGYVNGDIIHTGEVNLSSNSYHVSVYNTSDGNTIYDQICIHSGEDIIPSTDCAKELGFINKNGIDYSVSWIDDNGIEAILSGDQKENIGILGTDPSGVISGKSQPVSRTQQVTIKLSYRGLQDANDRVYKTFIECETGCRASEGIKTLKIERTKVDRTSNSTNYYLKVYFE